MIETAQVQRKKTPFVPSFCKKTSWSRYKRQIYLPLVAIESIAGFELHETQIEFAGPFSFCQYTRIESHRLLRN